MILIRPLLGSFDFSFKKTCLLSTAVLGGFLSSLMLGLPAVAQLGVSPVFLEAQAERGRAQGVITFRNSTDSPIRARVYSEPFTYHQDGFATLSESPEDLSPYLQLSPREAVIAPGGTQRVRLLGLFPPSLPAGEYRAVIFAEELADSTQPAGNVMIRARIGTTVYMRQGELSAELLGVDAMPRDQAIDLLVENQGTATARAEVRWQLDHEGSAMAIVSGEVEPYTIVAQKDRRIGIALPDTLPSGRYTLRGELLWTTLGEYSTQPFELPVLIP